MFGKLPTIFHSGHSGIGSGMRCGRGLRLEYSNPMHLDDVAISFPDLQIVIAHPSFPWQDEVLSVATHKPNVWIDLSGWSPKYFPKQLVQYANTLRYWESREFGEKSGYLQRNRKTCNQRHLSGSGTPGFRSEPDRCGYRAHRLDGWQ